MTLRARVLLLVTVSLGLVGRLCAADRGEERYSVMLTNEKAGYATAKIDGRRVAVVYHVDENGRGPKTRETLTLDERGFPTEWHIDGKAGTGAPVDERFTRKGGRAQWKSLNDSVTLRLAF